jgi:hypothetical protein
VFACLNSGPGKVGDNCVDSAGTPTCGDGLACLELDAAGNGVCTPYCDSMDTSHACPTGEVCGIAVLPGGLEFDVCVSPDAGTGTTGDAGGTTPDAGGSD